VAVDAFDPQTAWRLLADLKVVFMFSTLLANRRSKSFFVWNTGPQSIKCMLLL